MFLFFLKARQCYDVQHDHQGLQDHQGHPETDQHHHQGHPDSDDDHQGHPDTDHHHRHQGHPDPDHPIKEQVEGCCPCPSGAPSFATPIYSPRYIHVYSYFYFQKTAHVQ